MSADFPFNSRRSVVVSCNGSVACSQPLAAQIGLDILKSGGNAADAAVAVAAALNLTEPCSTGIGGDAFCLFYDAKSKSVKGVNGSGRASSRQTLELLKSQGFTAECPFTPYSGHTVTVPGAAAAWVDTVETFGSGKLSLRQILQPAIDTAESGFPVQACVAHSWAKSSGLLKNPDNKYGKDMLLNGEAPQHGDVMRMPLLAQTFRELASCGKKGFYEGRVAKAVVDVVQEHDGCLTVEDLQSHTSTFDQPISTDYRGCRVWEMPPNGQGITALIALNILEGFDLKSKGHNSAEYIHLLLEALRLSFADTRWYCADPSKVVVPIEKLLSKEYASKRRALIDPKRAQADVKKGSPVGCSDTVYFTTADKDGNACSFINSNFHGFGTALLPEGCGFTLQNRGLGFSLDPTHPNVIAPGKRPYHTIIPALATSAETGDLLAGFGVMGGFVQPQGHVQVLLNMLEFGMDPQQSLDQSRFCIGGGYKYGQSVDVEEGISADVVSTLQAMGHNVKDRVTGRERLYFGRGQIITRGSWWRKGTLTSDPVYWSGSDPRADGLVAAY